MSREVPARFCERRRVRFPPPTHHVAMCHSREQAEQVKAGLTAWLEPRGLRFNEDKTRIVHVEDGFSFLGFDIRRRIDRQGSGKLLITPSKESVKRFRKRLTADVRSMHGANAAAVVFRLNQIVRGWANYFRQAVAKHTFRMLGAFLWHRVIMWLKTLHRWSWKDIRRWLLGPDGSWLPITVDGVELVNPARTPAITRYRYRGDTIPTPWTIA